VRCVRVIDDATRSLRMRGFVLNRRAADGLGGLLQSERRHRHEDDPGSMNLKQVGLLAQR
jgi:hypothetical protein